MSRRVSAKQARTGRMERERWAATLRSDPARARKMYPRLSWAEVVKRGGWLMPASADERRTSIQEMECIPTTLTHQAAFALYDCGAPLESVRAAVEMAWIRDSSLFMALAGDQAYDLLRHCQFELPPELGPKFPVWRGTRGVPLEVARTGHCWTTNPLVAATWAEHVGAAGLNVYSGAPLVVRRNVQAKDCILFTDHGGMSEVVVDAPPDGEVDGTPDEWRAAAIGYARQLSFVQAANRIVNGAMDRAALGLSPLA